MASEGIEYVHSGNGSGQGAVLGGVFNIEGEELPLPSCEHVEGDVDLAAEGLRVRLRANPTKRPRLRTNRRRRATHQPRTMVY